MFDVDLSDLTGSSKNAGAKWVAVAPIGSDRQAAKRSRAQARGLQKGDGALAGGRDARSTRAEGAGERGDVRNSNQDSLRRDAEGRDPTAPILPPEEEEGNVEYKLRLMDPSPARLEQLITQMKYRLAEGDGEAEYVVGVEDGGYGRGLEPEELRATLNVVACMAEALGAHAGPAALFAGAHGRACARVRVARACIEDVCFTELRVAVGGGVGCGKSSLIAVLTHGADGAPLLDDGAGRARTAVFKHKHEVETGHTSSVTQCLLGYAPDGRVLNYSRVAALTASELGGAAARILHFIDLCGHSRFLKTALYGMTSLLPDFHMLCISAVTGVQQTTREHFAAALALDTPTFCVITKADTADGPALAATLESVREVVAAAAGAAAARPAAQVVGSTDDAGDVSDAGAAPSGRGEGIRAVSSVPGGHMGSGNVPNGIGGAEPEATDQRPSADDVCRPIDTGCTEDAAKQLARPKLERRAPVVRTCEEAVQVAEVLHVQQQQQQQQQRRRHTGQGRAFAVPVIITSAVDGTGAALLHAFLSHLQQAPRHKQPAALSADRHVVESLRHGAAATIRGPGAAALPPRPSQGSAGPAASPAAGLPSAVAGDGAAAAEEPVHFQVDHVYDVAGVGTVVSGAVVRGCIALGAALLWGPGDDADGTFVAVTVEGIRRAQLPVARVAAGQYATLALGVTRAPLRGGRAVASRETGAAPIDPVARLSLQGGAVPAAGREPAPRQIPPGPAARGRVGTAGQVARATLGEAVAHRDGVWEAMGDGTETAGGAEERTRGLARGVGPESGAGIGAGRGLGRLDSGGSGDVQRTAGPCTVPIDPWLPLLLRSTGTRGGLERGGPGAPIGKARKGTVLLAPGTRPRAAAGMTALVILTNGQWPPRGLVSGRWPPGASGGERVSAPDGVTPARRLPQYVHVIHCGSTRQGAVVEAMQELAHDWAACGCEVHGVNMAASRAAAAVLAGGGAGAGTLVDAAFRFPTRRAWVTPGMRFVIRDQLGRISGVGIVQAPLHAGAA